MGMREESERPQLQAQLALPAAHVEGRAGNSGLLITRQKDVCVEQRCILPFL